ncbi:MAG: hypothetical protein IPO58_24890 [Betaproteobacteria bacterium]|nr:hypothetical protein [Betaproteobacteria bacterium]
MIGSRALWADGWKAVVEQPQGGPLDEALLAKQRWELYHVAEDFSECADLAATHPGKLAELIERWWVEAGKYNVLPLIRGCGRDVGARSSPAAPRAATSTIPTVRRCSSTPR